MVFDIFPMRNQSKGVFSELLAVLLRILVIGAVVVRDLDEPDGCAYKNIQVLGIRLHIRYCLDR